MGKWLVRYVSLSGEHIAYTVEAEDACDAYFIADAIFQKEDPNFTGRYTLEGVYHYDTPY